MKYTPLVLTILSLFAIIIFMIKSQPPIVIQQEPSQPPVVITPPPLQRDTAPEFRGPPLKRYKPRTFQQMGLLLGDGETLPLYGRESRTHRDRYHYYTSTTGEQIYSLPISYEDRDCTEDIGCPEFYGNEVVNVRGKDGDYTVDVYRTENFPQFY